MKDVSDVKDSSAF